MYISPSEIVETGYTQGYRFVLPYSQDYYKGFYHKDKNNRYWTGQEHTAQSMLLKDLFPPASPSDFEPNNLIKNTPYSYMFKARYQNDLSTPLLKSDFIVPTEINYNNGYFIRYIAQLKISKDLYIIELNNTNYVANSRSTKVAVYYDFVSLPWMLVGPINDIYKDNIRVASGVKDTNLRSIKTAESRIPQISTYLTDPLQYARV